jgi:hypothetical protein
MLRFLQNAMKAGTSFNFSPLSNTLWKCQTPFDNAKQEIVEITTKKYQP